jgi:nitrate/nitrite transport system permease protein
MTAIALKILESDVNDVSSAPLLTPVEAKPVPAPTNPVLAWTSKLKLPDGRATFEALWPPIVGIGIFLGLWALLAPQVKTSLGALPGPGDVWTAFLALMGEHDAARAEAAAAVAAGGLYSGPPTFIDQIYTSLYTVATGFLLASIVAVPLGLIAGLSKRVNAAINPIVQVMRPVSPLAWLPVVTMVVSASITSENPTFAKSFVISAVVVMLCSMWSTLINTAIGVASIDKDLLNVGRVLRLGWFAKLTKLVLPSAMPYIFTGMRLSLGVGWMVLIAAEMLWDEFQNGSDRSLARIMVAVVVIGLIGVVLDQIMRLMQNYASRHSVR